MSRRMDIRAARIGGLAVGREMAAAAVAAGILGFGPEGDGMIGVGRG